jgi:hypothetical protein
MRKVERCPKSPKLSPHLRRDKMNILRMLTSTQLAAVFKQARILHHR